MNTKDNIISAGPIRAAVIGLGTRGQRVLEALQRCEAFEIVALTDRNASRVEPAAARLGVPSFTDSRSMFSQAHPQALFITTPPMVNADLIAACAQRGVHVWKLAPLARDLREAAAMIRQMQQAKLTFMVGTYRRFMEPYRRAAELRSQLGPLQLARAEYLFNWGPIAHWRSDRQAAGGGALMELGYHFVDLLLWTLGLPEEVFSLTSVSAHNAMPAINDKPTQVPCDTDDTATAIMRFPGGAMASLITSRISGPVTETLCLHGIEGSITADPQCFILRDPDGGVREEFDSIPGPIDGLEHQIEVFSQAILTGSETYRCSAKENLLTMAIIEAMYLSQKTGQAENPGELLKTTGFTVAQCAPPMEDYDRLPDHEPPEPD